jgi:hypothetical protein
MTTKTHKVGKGRRPKRRYVYANELRVGDVLTGEKTPDEVVTATEDLGTHIRLTLGSGRVIQPYFESAFPVLVKE